MNGSTPRDEVGLSPNAITVLEKRYLLRDEAGKPVESAASLFWRVARTVAEPDRKYGASEGAVEALADAFFDLMSERKFMPNSPTLMNAGRPLGQLSACFVLPVDDALSNGQAGIYDTLRSMALVHQSGGGTGFSFSRLRPKNDIVRSTMGVASGPVSFMSLFDASTDVVKQGGTRRGANMGILRVDHPDILDFISCKDDITKITNFNISVAVTDAFMQAVETDEEYDLIHPNTRKVVGRLRARDVWEKIIHGAWRTGEPGVYFTDRANYYNPVPHLGSYEATNPCGEQPLLPYDVCNLGSINVGVFVRDGEIDWDGLRQVVHLCTHFLENVIDANNYPLPQITDLAHRIRRIGLGVMGLADAFILLGVAYDSDEAVDLGRRIQAFIDEEAKRESERLATIRGVFPEWERSIWGPDETCARGPKGERIRPMRKLRNCNVTTVAPTGTISIIASCSSGIEPLFAVAFMRNQAGVLMPDVNEEFVAIAKREGWYSEELMKRIAESGNIRFPEVPAKWQRVFVTANEIKPEWHIRMQGAFQENNDSAISKTCNFANDATEAYVEEIYRLAYKLGCKGVTVYRDGSRDMQVLSTGSVAKKVQEQATSTGKSEARADLAGMTNSSGRGRSGPRRPAWRAGRGAGRERAAQAHGARARGGDAQPPPEAVASRTAPRHHAPHRDPARHALRHHHGRRSCPALRGLHEPGQGRWGADGRRRGDRPAHQPGAAVGHSAQGDLPPAPRHQLRQGHGPWAEQDPLGARCGGHRDRAVAAGEAGDPAGPAHHQRDPGAGRGRRAPRDFRRRAAARARWHAEHAVGRLPGLQLAAGVRRGMREVPRVRLLRVRLTFLARS